MARSSSSHHPAWRAQHGVCVCVCRAQRGPSGSERIMHAGRVPSIARIDDGMMHGACAWHAARGTAPLALAGPDQTAWRQSPCGTAGNACRAPARQRLLVCRREQLQAAVDKACAQQRGWRARRLPPARPCRRACCRPAAMPRGPIKPGTPASTEDVCREAREGLAGPALPARQTNGGRCVRPPPYPPCLPTRGAARRWRSRLRAASGSA